MIRSLYVRVVLTFLGSAIGGMIVAALVATIIFEGQMNDTLIDTSLAISRDIALIYETLPYEQAKTIVDSMEQLQSFYVRIYDESGVMQEFGNSAGIAPSRISSDMLSHVLSGQEFKNPDSSQSSIVVGVPLPTSQGSMALFTQSNYTSVNVALLWIMTTLANSLGAGSVFIVIATLFLVRPINQLTKATKRLAGGDFSVKLNMKRKDELGTLARSFNEMTQGLRQLESMRQQFVSNVSHEIQSPLTSIAGYAQALQSLELSEQERRRYLDIIIAESGRVSAMSDNLLKLTMLESENVSMQTVPYRLDEQLRRIIVANQPLWAARDIRFELDLPHTMITADPDQLELVWTNIINNGIKFSPEGSTMRITIKNGIKEVSVLVSDSGIGISEEDQARIFERFFKADRSRNRKIAGNGLGLSIVKQIVSLHHGNINVESVPGQGTTFIITLPITAPV
ncbi:HAMP domain-containing histidine kinase [Paenibacillus sp. IB182496]|uniref:Heme sensor protein HssS n=1 Tax=Paenibacillus sabuli TaxID=2772509 RepID=A0A927BRE6_9BACL|nr:HAMP domain-containing sensor histidine kinase [Paenibacillus sabuli]MBD2844315.1 HAMP domain-containing histidine kinase [Paenibacillus sabuli]